MYRKLAGMTGTALTEAEEFDKIYKLAVLPIPTNLEYQAFGPQVAVDRGQGKRRGRLRVRLFRPPRRPAKESGLLARKDYPDVIYRTAEAKLRAIVREIVREHVRGRPMLVGTSFGRELGTPLQPPARRTQSAA
jgi:preprotein translocase subunit SecA